MTREERDEPQMTIDANQPRTRRAVLTAGLAGLGATVLQAVGRPASVSAVTGDPLILGMGTSVVENVANGATAVNYSPDVAGETAFIARLFGPGTALSATSQYGTGVYAFSQDIGVNGQAGSGTGVHGESAWANPSTFTGISHKTGVLGSGGPGTLMAPNTDETGVYGFSDVSVNSTGVWGDSIAGTGVVGTGDWGVFGSGAVGVYAHAASPTAYGLYTTGKVHFHGKSGRKTITSGRVYVDVAVAGMTASSAVIATLQTYKAGYAIAAVVSYSGKFRLYLNKSATSRMYFSYLVTD
jgi:hypothetical protein